MKTNSLVLLSSVILACTANAVIVAQWDFNRDADGVLPAAASPAPSIGSGTASGLVVTGLAFASGSPTDPSTAAAGGAFGNNGWQLPSGWPGQEAGSGTAGARFDVPTTGISGYSGLLVNFDLRTSNAASRWFRLDYTSDGSTWVEGTPTRMGLTANAGDTWHENSVTIPLSGVLDNADFGFRIVSVFSADAFIEANTGTAFEADSAYEVARNTTSTYSGGTWRFDMVTVTAIPEPSVALLGGLGMLALLRRRRR